MEGAPDAGRALYPCLNRRAGPEGFSLSAQRESLAAFVRSQGWETEDLYADEGFSGKDLHRPALGRLIQGAQEKRIDVVLVWKVDRLSRRQQDVLHLIEDVFAPNGVGFRSVTEAFDTTTPAGMAMLGMLAVFAQLERATIVERSLVGMRRRILERRWTGVAPYGYRYGTDGRLAPEPKT
ncbi:integrase, partial [mine drainage metagenome]